jgi:hypothetical protein
LAWPPTIGRPDASLASVIEARRFPRHVNRCGERDVGERSVSSTHCCSTSAVQVNRSMSGVAGVRYLDDL